MGDGAGFGDGGEDGRRDGAEAYPLIRGLCAAI